MKQFLEFLDNAIIFFSGLWKWFWGIMLLFFVALGKVLAMFAVAAGLAGLLVAAYLFGTVDACTMAATLPTGEVDEQIIHQCTSQTVDHRVLFFGRFYDTLVK